MYTYISRNFSGAVAVIVGSVQFQIAPLSSLHFSISIKPLPVQLVLTFSDFNLLHRSFLKRFPLFIWLLFAVSLVFNFSPDTGGRRQSLIQVHQFSSALLWGGRGAADRCRCVWGALAVLWPHWVCPAQWCLCFPLYPAQAPGYSIWSRPSVECSFSFRVLHKSTDSLVPVFCALPGLSGSGSQRLGRPLPGCGAPFPSAAPAPPVGCPYQYFRMKW